MKFIYLILVTVFTALIFNYCENSLGYDPKVVVRKINDNEFNSDDIPTGKSFVIDSVFFSFYEIYPEVQNKIKKIKWDYKTLHKEIVCDTTGDLTFIKLDLKFTNNEMNDAIYIENKVNDRIIDFEILFSNRLNPVYFSYALNDSYPDNKWIKLTAKDIQNQRTITINGALAPSYLFLNEENLTKKYIRLSFSIELFSVFKYYNRKFIGFITLFL